MDNQQPFTRSEIDDLRKLLEIEKIKALRLKYSYYMDSRQLDALAELFAEDALCEFGPYGNWSGVAAIANGFNTEFKDTLDQPFWSMHANTNHQISITGPDTAEGQIYLLDVVTDHKPDENPFLWFAVYDETYVKIDQVWKIQRTSIHFLWPQKHLDSSFIKR
ncbi:MAG: nuclear transport factor 2 family protein [Porticoccaceae bacterium]|nr:nuclear transport factor 2 family protein [Porticoccaceae bacterium]